MNNEEFLRTIVAYFVKFTEAGAALVIFSGTVICFGQFIFFSVTRNHPNPFQTMRLNLARFLALGLEFQLASDLLRTAVAPSFEEIGKLAAVAAIRTALNYFLSRENYEVVQEKPK